MLFIERHFGFAPDHGDGSIEVMIVVVAILVIVFAAIYWFDKRESKHNTN
jgi:membrane protein DedA with SNARE-associated domain